MDISKIKFFEAWEQTNDALFAEANNGKTTITSKVSPAEISPEGKTSPMKIEVKLSADLKTPHRISTVATELLSKKASDTTPPESIFVEIECLTHEAYRQIRELIAEVLLEAQVMKILDVKKIGVGVNQERSWYVRIEASLKMSDDGKTIDQSVKRDGIRALHYGRNMMYFIRKDEAAVKLCQEIAKIATGK